MTNLSIETNFSLVEKQNSDNGIFYKFDVGDVIFSIKQAKQEGKLKLYVIDKILIDVRKDFEQITYMCYETMIKNNKIKEDYFKSSGSHLELIDRKENGKLSRTDTIHYTIDKNYVIDLIVESIEERKLNLIQFKNENVTIEN